MKDTGVIQIHGKSYMTVALRVQKFREDHPNWSINTRLLHRDNDCVVMMAAVLDETGRIIGTGHAEEYRSTSNINKTSALENAETSSIGRCLAACGYLGGGEFASADEVAHAIKGKPAAPITPTTGAAEAIDIGRRELLTRIAQDIASMDYENPDELSMAHDMFYGIADNEEKIYVWDLLKPSSKLRAAIKKHHDSKGNK